MTTKCTGLMGRIFGHKWQWRWWDTSKRNSYVCQRCGAVTGENK